MEVVDAPSVEALKCSGIDVCIGTNFACGTNIFGTAGAEYIRSANSDLVWPWMSWIALWSQSLPMSLKYWDSCFRVRILVLLLYIARGGLKAIGRSVWLPGLACALRLGWRPMAHSLLAHQCLTPISGPIGLTAEFLAPGGLT